ncbi:uncharacterized protein LOC120151690 [Hibiscus syriacus]|uniref:uncharacterized protein LOC120151690 n=1 Tax=Hibiscus syriacus TaxID=106335 RepID=UPI0019242176|nr:uncharacterized protein LOC120151690 [Hibiscus syriacus]
MNPGSSVVNIVFEGVYMETEENGGERLMCLVGSSASILPCTDTCEYDVFSEQNSQIPRYNRRHIRFLQDDQVLLVLRYPKIFKLTKRAIRGEMLSLNTQGGPRYFSKVYISSQMNGHSKYQFSSELLQSTTFDPPPYQDEMMEGGVQMFTARDFCAVLDYEYREIFSSIAPNYRFSSSHKLQIHGNLGPFMLGNEMDAGGDLSYDNVEFIFQHVKCEQDPNRTDIANVSAVLRAFTKGSFQYFERLRTGLSGSTLATEGIWNSSSGQLFMVGCQGTVDMGSEGCDYVIAMYSPQSFSINQRSFLFGTIINVKKDIALDNPLYFNARKGIGARDFTEYLPYNYSKINLVSAFQKVTLSYQILNIAKQWLFLYPALKDGEDPFAQLSILAEDLALVGYAVPDGQLIAGPESRVLTIQVLSLGPLSGWSEPNFVKGNLCRKPDISKDDLTSCRFWNVSMHLAFSNMREYKQTTYKNISELYLEGVYDPIMGEMHLIGCRKASVASVSIERGQDCLISVKIQYPPVNLQWWKKPIAEITFSSQRKEYDPLYFSLITIHARLTQYPDYLKAAANRAYLVVIVGIVLLTVSIAIIWNQLSYMKVTADIAPYISTTMIAFQFLGYSLPLIYGGKVILKSMEPEAYNALPSDQHEYGMLKFLQSFERALLLVVILLTARLFNVVTESRSKTLFQGSSNPRYGSREKRVLLSSMAIYTFGFLIWLVAGYNPDVQVQQLNIENDMHEPRNGQQILQTRMGAMEVLVYFLQNYFLLPQIISNGLMAMPGKSLKEAYYLGLTLIRLLVHFLNYIVDPVINAKVERFQVSSSNSTYLMLPRVLGPITMIICAVRVYIQQNWKNKKH